MKSHRESLEIIDRLFIYESIFVLVYRIDILLDSEENEILSRKTAKMIDACQKTNKR